MKKLIVLSILVIITNHCTSQIQAQDSINYFISNLNARSVTVSTTYVPKLLFDSISSKLVSIGGTSIEQKLYARITDKEKALAIHAILTMRYKKPTYLSQLGKYKKDTLVGLYFTYNDLKWYYEINSGKSRIEKKNLRRIKSYWKRIIFQDKNRK